MIVSRRFLNQKTSLKFRTFFPLPSSLDYESLLAKPASIRQPEPEETEPKHEEEAEQDSGCSCRQPLATCSKAPFDLNMFPTSEGAQPAALRRRGAECADPDILLGSGAALFFFSQFDYIII